MSRNLATRLPCLFRSLKEVKQPHLHQQALKLFSNRISMTSALWDSDGERRIRNLLESKLDVKEIDVRDISGGCGSMYEIYVSSKDFKDKRTVQQHRMVNEILKEEVKQMHGLRIHTTVPE